MDKIDVPGSVWLDGQWFDAQWLIETVDEIAGEKVITATVDGGPSAPRVAALRIDVELMQRLWGGEDGRNGAGCDCRTTTQRLNALERDAGAGFWVTEGGG